LHLTINQLTVHTRQHRSSGLLAKVTALQRYLVFWRCPAGAVDEYDVTDSYSSSTPQKPTFFDGHYLRNH